jgi:hypothetical protein
VSEDFPRLLVATEFPPNASGGGPAVVRQMLKNWPSEKLLWWSCFPDEDERFHQTVDAHEVATIPKRLYPHERARMVKSWLLEHVWTRWAVRHLRKVIDRHKPDAIWVIAHCWSIPPLEQALPASGAKFHVSIHDYADINSCRFRFGAERSKQMAAAAERLYASATTRDAISESMLDDLQCRTGSAGVITRAGLEPQDFQYLENKTETEAQQVRIAYAGTILVEETFAAFVKALNNVRPRVARPVRLEFFSAHTYATRDWFDPSWMFEHGLMTESELSRVLKSATWGFAPMSLTDDDPRYNRFSLPTKFVSYLAAGLPIITMGHPDSTLMQIAKSYQLGPSLNSADPKFLEEEIAAALLTQNPSEKFRREIRRCSHDKFDALQMRKLLYEHLAIP